MTAFFAFTVESCALAMSAETPSMETTTSAVGLPATVIVPFTIPVPDAADRLPGNRNVAALHEQIFVRVIFLPLVLESKRNLPCWMSQASLPPSFLSSLIVPATLSADSSPRERH